MRCRSVSRETRQVRPGWRGRQADKDACTSPQRDMFAGKRAQGFWSPPRSRAMTWRFAQPAPAEPSAPRQTLRHARGRGVAWRTLMVFLLLAATAPGPPARAAGAPPPLLENEAETEYARAPVMFEGESLFHVRGSHGLPGREAGAGHRRAHPGRRGRSVRPGEFTADRPDRARVGYSGGRPIPHDRDRDGHQTRRGDSLFHGAGRAAAHRGRDHGLSDASGRPAPSSSRPHTPWVCR